MKSSHFSLTVMVSLMLVLGFMTASPAQTEPKWIQPPELSDLGMDVNATLPRLLADDFECRITGPITNIVVWGSWFQDQLPDLGPESIMFNLSFHADIPAGPDTPSMPGEVLWWTNVVPGQFFVDIEADQLQEGWFNPEVQQYIPAGDTVCWRYTFSFDPDRV